jgi:hypothetical protein
MAMDPHHITDSGLQCYYLGSFQGIELDILDEHLLGCPICSLRLTSLEERDQTSQGKDGNWSPHE